MRFVAQLQILQTGQEIQELDHSGFSTQTATVFAGNVGDGRYILQVSSSGVRLLDGGRTCVYSYLLNLYNTVQTFK